MTRAIHPTKPRRRSVVRLAVVALGTAAMLSQLAGLRASGAGGPVRLEASPAMLAGPHGVTSQVTAHDGKFWVGSAPINLRGINTVPLKNLDPGMTDADYATIASWHMNLVRMHVKWAAVEGTAPQKSGSTWIHFYNAQVIQNIKDQIAMATAHGQYVLIENYCGPPCFTDGYPYWLYQSQYNSHGIMYTDSTSADNDFWTDPLQKQFLTSYLTYLAQQLAGTPGIVGYEVLNEPARGYYPNTHATSQMVIDTELTLANAVRAADPARVIFFMFAGSEGNGIFQADLSGWRNLGNVALDVHDFFGGRWGGSLLADPSSQSWGEVDQDQYDFTLTPGAPVYLGSTVGQIRFAQTFTSVLDPLGIPLFVGEIAGQPGWAEANMNNLVGSMCYAMNSQGVSWAYESYNDKYGIFQQNGQPYPWVNVLSAAAGQP